MSYQFAIKKFDNLTSVDLYYILQSRSAVFIIEQKRLFQDIDEVDFDSLHVIAHKAGVLIGYCRIIPPPLIEKPKMHWLHFSTKKTPLPPCLIDKLLILPEHRGYGIAHEMMNIAIHHCKANYPKHKVKMTVQQDKIGFCQSLGFKIVSKPCDKNNASQVDIILDPKRETKASKDKLNFSYMLGLALVILGLFFIAGILYLMPQ